MSFATPSCLRLPFPFALFELELELAPEFFFGDGELPGEGAGFFEGARVETTGLLVGAVVGAAVGAAVLAACASRDRRAVWLMP